MQKMKKDDTVIVLSGKDKGKKGKILKVLKDEGKVVVERVNIVKKHQRPTRNFPGGIIEKPLPIYLSKVMLVCPQCGEPTRPQLQNVGGKKVRVCRKCDELIDKG
ncbi:MAG: 50S ribosomal protein L24 [Candidatus Margulisiibacteriota bacterium]